MRHQDIGGRKQWSRKKQCPLMSCRVVHNTWTRVSQLGSWSHMICGRLVKTICSWMSMPKSKGKTGWTASLPPISSTGREEPQTQPHHQPINLVAIEEATQHKEVQIISTAQYKDSSIPNPSLLLLALNLTI